MLLYIDYLDHVLSNTIPFSLLEYRLRFELLIFGKDVLCMSVPACVKMKETTKLLTYLDEFWRNGRIRLQLDNKHKGDAIRYFNNRKRILEKSMDEEHLIHHFEFIAYEDARTDIFYRQYLPQITNVSSQLYISKGKDTDMLFRENTCALIQIYFDEICRLLFLRSRMSIAGMLIRIQEMALDKSYLFQRALIEDRIRSEFKPTEQELSIICTILDKAFALANADTSNAVPLSFVRNQLTGRWLYSLLDKAYINLKKAIIELSWNDVYLLSQDSDWLAFIGYINAYIYLVQESVRRNYKSSIESCIKKLSKSINLFTFLNSLKDQAVDVAKEKLFDIGLFTEAQKFEIIVELCVDCYSGKNRIFLDVVYAIDMLANRITEKITKDKKFSYLLILAEEQKKKGFEIIR